MEILKPIFIDDYDYALPEDRIAKFPLEKRDKSKLLIFKNNYISETTFDNIHHFLPEKSHLVFNNTKVIPARLYFENENRAIIEVLLLRPYKIDYTVSLSSNKTTQWECIIGNKKRWKLDKQLAEKIETAENNVFLTLKWINYEKNIIEFNWQSNTKELIFGELLTILGEIPLPPYLNRKPENEDTVRYQTVYSEVKGAVAAPTAGLHFTESVFNNIAKSNFSIQFITLHIGAGTFLPVKAKNALDHTMHQEQIIFHLTELESLLENINQIIPVGTTSMRSLESLYWFGVKIMQSENQSIIPFFIEKLYPYSQLQNISATNSLAAVINYMAQNNLNTIVGETQIMIVPGYKFKICKGIITNFHQPKSTLILLVSALIGEKWKEVYNYALKNKFRFLSFGDSSLLLPN